MKIAGIIAEYNPFHNGHAHHIAETRRRTGCDFVVVCMDGSYTQRGDAACLDKWTRARVALACGADAVFELPTLWAVRTADHFARGGVAVLGGLGCDILSFGCESGDEALLKKLALLLRLGLPLSMRIILIAGTQFYLLSYINSYGLAASAAYNVSDKIYHLANIVAMSVREAGGTMVAQNIGAKRHDRVKETVKCASKVTYSAAVLLSAVSLIFPKAVFGLFTSDPAVLEQAGVYMAICCIVYVLTAVMAPFDGVVSGTGNSRLGFLGGILDGVVCRVGFGMLFGLVLGWGAPGFFMGDAMARLGIVAVGAVYYYSGAWKKHKILSD